MIVINTVWRDSRYRPVYEIISSVMQPYDTEWNLSAPLPVYRGEANTVYSRLLMIKADLTEQQKFLIKLKLSGHMEND